MVSQKQNMARWSSLEARRVHNPKVVGSNPTPATVALAELAMHRIVVPDYAGSNPVGHLTKLFEK